MTVQSARVQEVVKGDDVVLTHQIMQSVAYNAEATRAPVTASALDKVTAFYPLADLDDGTPVIDTVGYSATLIGAPPSSLIQVKAPGRIPAVGNTSERGTKTWQSGAGRTVRVEIAREKALPTGDTTIDSYVVTNLSSVAGISLNDSFSGPNIPLNAVVTAIGISSVTLDQKATATAVTQSFFVSEKESHYLIAEVDVFERGFPNSLSDTSGGVNPPQPPLNLT